MNIVRTKGVVELINPTERKGVGFSKRSMVLAIDGNFTQYVTIDFINQDADVLEKIKVGQSIVVEMQINGKKYVDKVNGSIRYFNSIIGKEIFL